MRDRLVQLFRALPSSAVQIAILVASLPAMLSSPAHAADMPIGIPEPSFGIDENAQRYSGNGSYQMSENGPYTYFVDNRAENCTTTGSGTTSQPRCSIPVELAAGDVVEIHGGPYVFTDSLNVDAAGLVEKPVFVRGIDDGNGLPVLTTKENNGQFYLAGSYAILESLEFVGMGVRIGGQPSSHHLAARDLNIHSHQYNCVGLSGKELLIMNSEIHHCRHETNDRHGVHVQGGSEFIWILGNHIHHNGANGIQYAHGAKSNPPDFVFVGGNHIHGDREVGVATKWAGRTVVSSNVIHSIRPSRDGEKFCFDDGSGCIRPNSSTNGPGIIVGADGYPQEKWVIFNLIYDTNHCIRDEEGKNVFIVGNVCANIPGGGVILEKRSKELVIAHNTFYNTGFDTGDGVIDQSWRDDFKPKVSNNLILSPKAPALWFESPDVARAMEFNNNLVWNNGKKFKIRWLKRGKKIGTTKDLRKAMRPDVAEMHDNQVANPKLNVPEYPPFSWIDFAPPPGSPAVAGANNILEALDARFKQSFGADVTVIPPGWQDRQFDIGAVAEGFGDPPSAPDSRATR